MACTTKSSRWLLTIQIRWVLRHSLSTTSSVHMGRRGRTQPQPPEKSAVDVDVDATESTGNDLYIDGKVKEKLTLRKKMERQGLDPNADPSQAGTFAAVMRQKLGQEKVRGQDEASETQEQEPISRKPKDLRYQTRDLGRLSANVVAKILRDRVIYDEGDIVALDKPYGLPVHGGPGMKHSIDSLLPQLSRALSRGGEAPELHLIHRLDKETTGVMLLARTEMTARILHEMFRKRQIVKRYLVITVGIPSPREGILDMAMGAQEVGGKHRMVVRPDLSVTYPESWGMKSRSNLQAQEAVTKYRVLSHHGNCALVQLEPSSGVKHQLRVHLAQGLGCPILGDHKYSHHDKLAPQKLTIGILRSLGISQPKARTVPMHLHAKQLVIPQTFKGQNIFISTAPPWFFKHNMKKLRLKYDK